MDFGETSPSVVIVSNSRDAHVPLVTRHLELFGVAFFVLNTEAFGREVTGSVTLGLEDVRLFRSGNINVDLQGVQAVWFRRPEVPEMSNFVSAEARGFAQAEQKAFLDGLLATLDCTWLSHPTAIRDAGHKIRQLRVARGIGFDVPPTLISQSPEECQSSVQWSDDRSPQS